MVLNPLSFLEPLPTTPSCTLHCSEALVLTPSEAAVSPALEALCGWGWPIPLSSVASSLWASHIWALGHNVWHGSIWF